MESEYEVSVGIGMRIGIGIEMGIGMRIAIRIRVGTPRIRMAIARTGLVDYQFGESESTGTRMNRNEFKEKIEEKRKGREE